MSPPPLFQALPVHLLQHTSFLRWSIVTTIFSFDSLAWTMISRAIPAVVSVVLLLSEVTGYVPYWPEYWYPGQSHKDYPFHPKYPYPSPKDNYPDYYPPYPPPPPPTPKPRGEEAFPGKFLGMGTVNSHYGGRQVELICSLRDGDGEIVSNVVWHKIKGSYPFQNDPPPLDCYKCAYHPIDYDDHRIKAYDYHGKSVLFIHEVHQEDYGLYRCSATSQSSFKGDIETVYQIVKL